MARQALYAELARRGEDAAREFLVSRGYEFCAQNLRLGSDEADLVMRAPDGATIVVVEVKTRSCPNARPEERVDAPKARSLVRLARSLEQRSNRRCSLRIDVIAINLPPGAEPSIHWFQNAIGGSGAVG
ncbi:MAG: YraN family protein [Phycisphaerales bacterium]|nr:YraN family protein [Phycisphaerales bacterium]